MAETAKTSLRTASIACLALWGAIWLLFLLIRYSTLDIRVIPGIGPFMLLALVGSVVAPFVAIGTAATALVRQPWALLNWIVFGCAVAILYEQVHLFMSSKWL